VQPQQQRKKWRQCACACAVIGGVCLSACMAFACSFVRVCMLLQHLALRGVCVEHGHREREKSLCVFETKRKRLGSDAKPKFSESRYASDLYCLKQRFPR
jgi:hypothetical protein